MAHSEILLLKPIDGLGGEGDIVKVRAGYARNYLLPREFAVPVTQANRKHIEVLRARRAERESKELDGARELATRLKTVSLAFAVKTGEGGKMFGSVTQLDLHAKLEEQGYKIEKKRVHIAGGHVKTLGKHEATVRLHSDVTVEISFEVVSENPIEEVKAPEAPAAGEKDHKPRKPRKEHAEGGEASAKPAAENKAPMSEFDELAAELKKNSARGPKKEKPRRPRA